MNRRELCAGAAALSLLGASPVPSSSGAPAAAGLESEYTLATPTGTIAGTALVPTGAGARAPAVLIVSGSGPVDRDGNAGSVKTDTYRLLANALAARGIATVRYDKRGVGASRAAGPAESALRFETYVDDAAAWIAKMRADARFGEIAVAGHSEGSLVGMLASAKAKPDAFVSLEGAGFPAAEILRKQLGPRLASLPDLAAANERILTALAKGRTTGDVPTMLEVLYRPSVQPYLISWFAYDPRVAIAALRAPLVVVQGAYDLQVSLDDAKALAGANPAAALHVIDRMSHVLKDAADGTLATQAATVYADPSLPIDPAVAGLVAATLGK